MKVVWHIIDIDLAVLACKHIEVVGGLLLL